VLKAAALAAALACAPCATAGAATPSVLLAKKLRSSMQTYYTKTQPGLKIIGVACKIAASGTSATCQAHFTVAAKRALGVFALSVQINTSTGSITTRTVGATCRDSKTGAKLSC
jgi:hypothetical protein